MSQFFQIPTKILFRMIENRGEAMIINFVFRVSLFSLSFPSFPSFIYVISFIFLVFVIFLRFLSQQFPKLHQLKGLSHCQA
jgi:hypothetical protein